MEYSLEEVEEYEIEFAYWKKDRTIRYIQWFLGLVTVSAILGLVIEILKGLLRSV